MIEKDIIYKVSIDEYLYTLSNNFTEAYFHTIENAITFLVHSYIKDFDIYNEEEIIKINKQATNEHRINDYGWIEVIELED